MSNNGLISSDIIASDDGTITIREVWNVKHPNCPVLVLDMTKWPFERREDAETVTHTYTKPRSA